MISFRANSATQPSATYLLACLLATATGCSDPKSAPESVSGGTNAGSIGGTAGHAASATGGGGANSGKGGTSNSGGDAAQSGGNTTLPAAGGSASASGGAPVSTAGGIATGGGRQIGGAGANGGTNPSGGATVTGGHVSTAGGAQTGGTAGRAAGGGGSSVGGGGTSAGGVAGNSTSTTGGASGVAGARTGWLEEWSSASSSRFYARGTSPNAATSNVSDNAASDGKALKLVLGASAQPTPDGGAEVGTNARMRFGTFSSRLRTADCTGQPNAGVVTGLFSYFNDGTDSTGDGLADNSEIDFEWLCAEPQTIYLTMWTDYRDSDAAQKRVSRGINLATGTILYTCYYTAFGDCTQTLSGVEAVPSAVAALSGYDSSARYYEYGFDWSSSRVVWWIKNPADAQKIVLWDYQGPVTRITQLSANFLTNVWHTSDWTPDAKPNAIATPSAAVSAWIDWTRYEEP